MSDVIHVDKGWGYERWFHNDEKYCGKLLHFNAGKRCSLHYHVKKHETFYVQSGLVTIYIQSLHKWAEIASLNGELIRYDLHPGQSLELPPLTIHQIIAIDESDIFEFSTQHFDNDSYRIERGD